MSEEHTSHSESDQTKPNWIRSLILRFIIPVLILVGGVVVVKIMMATKPEPQTRPAQRVARLIEAAPLIPVDHVVHIQSLGQVVARNDIDLKARVGGEIIAIDPRMVAGQVFHAGDILVELDASKYEADVKSNEAALAQSQSSMNIELGQQIIAKEDYELTSKELSGTDLDLVLRVPQLESAQANVAKSEALLDVAKLNLSYTKVKAPFDALIVERMQSLGAVITSNTALARVVDAAEFWIELNVPAADLEWIEEGCVVKVFDDASWGEGVMRKGTVLSVSHALDSESRMATVVAVVDDPLCLKPENAGKPVLYLGAYVRADIVANKLSDVVVIPRKLLRPGDELWLVGEDLKLIIEDAKVVHRELNNVVLGNKFQEGLKIVSSNLSTPVEGMSLRFAEKRKGPPSGMAKGNSEGKGTGKRSQQQGDQQQGKRPAN